MENTYFVFREARSVEELRSLFKLRYRVYRSCALREFVAENQYEIDMDAYDLRSRHFGLFQHNRKPVGYMRVVEVAHTPSSPFVERLAAEFPELHEKISPPIREPFPLLTYFPQADRIRTLYKKIKITGGRIVEPGRLSLHDSFRSRKLGQHLIESAIAIYFCTYGVDYAMLGCTPRHSAIYSKYGFERIPGTSRYKMGEIVGCALISTPQSIPSPARSRVNRMASAFHETGQICYHPSNPENFYAPAKRIAMPQPALRAAA